MGCAWLAQRRGFAVVGHDGGGMCGIADAGWVVLSLAACFVGQRAWWVNRGFVIFYVRVGAAVVAVRKGVVGRKITFSL
jgi:hypothetical protein